MADAGERGDDAQLLDEWAAYLGTVEGRLVFDFQTRFYRALGPTVIRTHPHEVVRAALSLAGATLLMQDDGESRMSEEEFFALARKVYRTCAVFHCEYSSGRLAVGVSAESLAEIVKASKGGS